MRQMFVAVILICALGGSIRAGAQNSGATGSTPPSYDMKGQSLLDLETVQKKFVELANAIPQDKFNWRPTSDSRSFAEVFLHVAGERWDSASDGSPDPWGIRRQDVGKINDR